ncbi:MAG TPA: DUF1003 domain-containing protein [Corynebacterium sp.]|jgi:uncharacterized membrane protein|uniref:DUF1003 domain-containing protein n=1 Tax=Corynebacterium sp. TaxID=1720 RepID=UPI0017D0C0F4|nr:DUF1003 domain-containing protein [Corynebacterium sp.]MDY0113084.1 DUF1003 domain-containing protein [Corynebacterium sp.]HHT32238.1 DUF1003 domain-containing protein [Corynebacterium sp.]
MAKDTHRGSERPSRDRLELDTPVVDRRKKFIDFDGDRVGEVAENVARFLGTGKYLAFQTIIVIVWIALNIGGMWWNWDPYPFILLNLAFSTQAAYAAPLILLAQNRQEDRDRASVAEDRRRAAETKADTEFLAREIAGVRAVVGEAVTRDYLRRELDDLTGVLERIEARLYEEDRHPGAHPGSHPGEPVTRRADDRHPGSRPDHHER